jgi:hypothetical protein
VNLLASLRRRPASANLAAASTRDATNAIERAGAGNRSGSSPEAHMAKGMSLHIGLNEVDPKHYAGWSGPLQACEADAEDMRDLAKEQGFAGTTVLMTPQATRQAVIDGIVDAAKALAPGDMFFLTYSGHGGQVPDANGDDPDGEDETWCLYDGQLLDDELYVLWSRFREGVRILVLSDSCHSGSVTRLALAQAANRAMADLDVLAQYGITEIRGRYMPPAQALRTYRRNRAFYDALGKDIPAEPPIPKASVRLISGCQDSQTSLDGTFNGLFTGVLLKVWKSGGFEGNYRKFHSEIVKRMPPQQTPNHFMVGTPLPSFDVERPFTVG